MLRQDKVKDQRVCNPPECETWSHQLNRINRTSTKHSQLHQCIAGKEWTGSEKPSSLDLATLDASWKPNLEWWNRGLEWSIENCKSQRGTAKRKSKVFEGCTTSNKMNRIDANSAQCFSWNWHFEPIGRPFWNLCDWATRYMSNEIWALEIGTWGAMPMGRYGWSCYFGNSLCIRFFDSI